MNDLILETRDLTKHYGGVHALEDADFVLRKGEHVAIVGDNGAGKSTLIKIFAGVHQQSEGDLFVEGEKVFFASPRDAHTWE